MKELILFIPIIGRIFLFLQGIFSHKRPPKQEIWIFLENTLLYSVLGAIAAHMQIGEMIGALKLFMIIIGLFLVFGFYEYQLMKKNPTKFMGNESDIKPINIFLVFYHEFWYFVLGYIIINRMP